ncbi:MAG: alpha/beta hydrolase [Gaiellaceae bacterium]
MKTRLPKHGRGLSPNALLLIAAFVIAGCGGSARPSERPAPTATIGELVPGTRPSSPAAFMGPVRQVRAGGILIGYRQLGSGPPLVLIAGEASSMSYWGYELPRRLSEHFRVTEFDNRGVGYSTDQPKRPLTIELMADDTARLLGALGIPKAIVVGWSTGGEIGLSLVERHPDEVRALVVSGATAGGTTEVDMSTHSGSLLGSLFPASARPAELAYFAGILAMPVEKVGRKIAERQTAAERRFAKTNDTYNGLSSIRVPVLVTAGGVDGIVPPANARLIAARIPQARLAIFPGAAHMMMFQDMDRFVGLVDQFASADR